MTSPFDGLPLEVLQAIAVYAWIGMVVCMVLGLYALDKARRPKKAAAVVGAASLPTVFAWLNCPDGHCKVNTNRNRLCPQCGAQMVSPYGIMSDPTGRFVAVLKEAA